MRKRIRQRIIKSKKYFLGSIVQRNRRRSYGLRSRSIKRASGIAGKE
jgi:hypothetical protein